MLSSQYEATLWAGILHWKNQLEIDQFYEISGSNTKIALTRIGGGAYGNPTRWIDEEMNAAWVRVQEKVFEIDPTALDMIDVVVVERKV